MKLSTPALQDLHKTIEAFFNAEGQNGSKVADQVIRKVKSKNYTFELWDAMGCDDLGLVAKNPELKKFYQQVTKTWTNSLKTTKH